MPVRFFNVVRSKLFNFHSIISVIIKMLETKTSQNQLIAMAT